MHDLISTLFPATQRWHITPHTLGHSAASVFFVERAEISYVLKIETLAPPFLLRKAHENLRWFRDRMAVPEVVWYQEKEGYALLLTEKVARKPSFLHPNRSQMGSILGQLLKTIHQIPHADFPDQENKSERQLTLFGEGQVPVWDLVLSHGDYCLPNILLSDAGEAHLIDLGEAGIYDRYHDLFWGMWSLDYNGFSDQIDLFLQAYGLRKFDYSKMNLIARMNGKSLDFVR